MANSGVGVSPKHTREALKKMEGAEVSLCIPSSIISKSNAKNLEQVTNIAYQVAKAALAYNVSEIVILDIPPTEERIKKIEADSLREIQLQGDAGNKKIKFNNVQDEKGDQTTNKHEGESSNNGLLENNSIVFATILQYFVTPKYLVKSVFHKNINKFKYAEKLPTITTLPFMNNNGVGRDFKEGLTIAKHTPKIQKKKKKVSAAKKLKVTKYVNIGGSKPLELLGPEVPVNVRVTVDIKNKKVVSPQTAYGVSGCKSSFGYHVRLARTFSAIFTESSHPEGYSESIFVNADNYFTPHASLDLPRAEGIRDGQVLIVIGNLRDLDYSFEQDNVEAVNNAIEMFDSELAVPAGLRIEDAALVGLAKLS